MRTEVNRHSSAAPAGASIVQLIDEHGRAVDEARLPSGELMLEMYRKMVLGRRFDEQATILARQRRLAVYAASRGQEACQVGAAMALRAEDWLFPTYRDSVAIFARGVDPVEVLSYTRGFWHTGYDPYATRVAPQCSPLATHIPHAVGLAHAARLKGDALAVIVLLGDGATSEGDTHEAFNFAGVLQAPVVFFIQNNGYAISVPVSRQTHAKSLADRARGYGMEGQTVDGNDITAVHAVLTAAVEGARQGRGPSVIEAITYRIEPHTNTDDSSRYRSDEEVESWRRFDPLKRLETHLRGAGLLNDQLQDALMVEVEALATDVRERMQQEPSIDPAELFEHVFASPTRPLLRQRVLLLGELSETGDSR
jgi:2-oxoisovalerate dehydrogenase E1 component alpha subunit